MQHTIIKNPNEYEIIYMSYKLSHDNYEQSYIELHLEKGGVVKKLKFTQPTELEIEKGFTGNICGMEILDINDKQLENIGVQVRNFEQDPGITFLAKEVVEIND